MSWLENQLENRNFLSPIGFKFVLDRAPKTVFLCQSANIPSIGMGSPEQATPFKNIPLSGDVTYEDLTISFLIDENMENYMEIHNWIKAISAADSFDRYKDFVEESKEKTGMKSISCDGSMMILTNNYNYNFLVSFKDMFPVSLGALQFDTGGIDVQFLTAEVTFKYTIYNIENMIGESI
jgi:hypothetical protein